MSRVQIPIDFVAGTHGHFLEHILNRFFHTTKVDFSPFNKLGSSHLSTQHYEETKLFCANHWIEFAKDQLLPAPCIISIKFTTDDILAVTSVSLLRANDMALDNDQLEVDTYNKLNNEFYLPTLKGIQKAYPFLNLSETNSSVPRSVLREFFKFGFRDPGINGYYCEQHAMVYPDGIPVFDFQFSWLYDINQLVLGIKELEKFLKYDFDFCDEFYNLHKEFLKRQIYQNHKAECDQIISDIVNGADKPIPKLTMLQESYINGRLENIYKKEMPFHQEQYFINTKAVSHYLNTQAPLL